ncbi:hypothetical protein ES288_D07G225300v1 [Gossypium darwinii]|uniref:Uncharacterized protein n=1 Tax=Gossypium darwinii TaxID=34276 RepID=A0A5D2BYK6_GOSDA|nr:hypothetical protein ES288_D07G225300v1 [Gossypium darwinii]
MRPCSTKPLGETLYRLNRIGRKYAHQSTGITTRTDRVLIYYNYRIESKEPKKHSKKSDKFSNKQREKQTEPVTLIKGSPMITIFKNKKDTSFLRPVSSARVIID